MRIALNTVFVYITFFCAIPNFCATVALYFTLLNSDLGIEHLIRKQRSLALSNMLLTLTCYRSLPTQKKNQISCKCHKKNTKLIKSQKLRIAQKSRL